MTRTTPIDDTCLIRGASEAEYQRLNRIMDALADTRASRAEWLKNNVLFTNGFVHIPHDFWNCTLSGRDLGKSVFMLNNDTLSLIPPTEAGATFQMIGAVTNVAADGAMIVIHIGVQMAV